MMKKSLLLPLLVASLMLASVVALESCKKEQKQQDQSAKANYESVKAGFQQLGVPMVESVHELEKGALYAVCPYCGDTLRPNVYYHWHAFGTVPDNWPDTIEFKPGEPFGQQDCLAEQSYFCPYSGIAAHDPDLIQFYMDTLHVSYTQADWMTLPRFHGHNVSYVIGGTNVNGGSGYHNDFHVGGGVPFWPQFGDPNNP